MLLEIRSNDNFGKLYEKNKRKLPHQQNRINFLEQDSHSDILFEIFYQMN